MPEESEVRELSRDGEFMIYAHVAEAWRPSKHCARDEVSCGDTFSARSRSKSTEQERDML